MPNHSDPAKQRIIAEAAAELGLHPTGKIDNEYECRTYEVLIRRGVASAEAKSKAEWWARLKATDPTGETVIGPADNPLAELDQPRIETDPITGRQTYKGSFQAQPQAALSGSSGGSVGSPAGLGRVLAQRLDRHVAASRPVRHEPSPAVLRGHSWRGPKHVQCRRFADHHRQRRGSERAALGRVAVAHHCGIHRVTINRRAADRVELGRRPRDVLRARERSGHCRDERLLGPRFDMGVNTRGADCADR